MQRDRFTQVSSSDSGNKMQIIQKAYPDRALPKSKTASQCQEDESNISHMHCLHQISILCQVELSIHLPPSLKRHASLKVSLTSSHPLENKSLIHHNWIIKEVSLGKTVEQRGAGYKHGENLRLPMTVPCKTRSLIFEEVGEAPNFQRTLILPSLLAGREEAQESS